MYITNLFPRSGLDLLRRHTRTANKAIVIVESANTSLGDGTNLPSVDTGPLTIVGGDGSAITTFNPTDAPSVTTETLLPSSFNTIQPVPSLISNPIPTPDSTSVYGTTATATTTQGSSNQGTASAGADNSNSNRSKSLPGGAIAGIVIAILLLALVAGVLVFRKRAISKRSKARRTWEPRPFVVATTTTVVTDALDEPEQGAGADTDPSQSAAGPHSVQKTIPRIKPPPLSLLSLPGSRLPEMDSIQESNASAGPRVSSRLSSVSNAMDNRSSAGHHFGSSAYNSPDPTREIMTETETMAERCTAPLVAHGGALTNIAVVRCVFEPRLPDELRIRVGENMRVLAEYDDGWALCENSRGVRGMIPQVCVDRGMGGGGAVAGYGGVGAQVDEGVLGLVSRRSARKSSLPVPAV